MKPTDKWSQFERIETFAFITLLVIAFILLLSTLMSCKSTAQTTPQEDERVYIHMSDGDSIELVADEYGNQYLKQITRAGWIYIPYTGETEDQSDTLHFYNAKNK